jgi:hypothetical protein
LAEGESHVKKSLKAQQKPCYRIRPAKTFQLRGMLPIQAATHLAGFQKKQSSSQPTIKKHHVPGGI